MKKKFIWVFTALFVSAFAVMGYKVNQEEVHRLNLIIENIEALSQVESEIKDGALWSNQAGTRFCCGSGNVRDCRKSGYVLCPDYVLP